MYRLFGIVLLILATGITACSGSKQNKQKYQTPQEAFEKGKALYEKKRYTDAIEFFKGVFDFGRTNEWADDAQYYLGLSYMGGKDYMVAEQELMRFVSLYRSDPRSIEAEFQRLICYYKLSPTFELDQTDTDRALTNMNIFLQRYPNDDRVSQISIMIKELREKLGQKAYEAGKTYERRGYYQAAAHTFEQVLQNYADTSWADNALLGAIRSYVLYAKNSVESKQAERFDKAITTYNRLVELYPKSEVLKTAEVLYMEATTLKSAIKPKS
ncbi:MAG: outer membrane protein assembly factor BamD [Bacteroidetes Order II. Incertae sedis bacterium]|nr:outer membrane protein assembly factor BamD [Bacteroidetes Order II. bacterium]